MLGERIGNYRIAREAGAIGTGSVYEATHEHTGRRAVLKVLLVRSPDDPLTERLLNEVCAAAALQHPGLVVPFDVGRLPDDTIYFLLDSPPGEPLSAWLSRGKLPLDAALRLGRQLSWTLAAAHKAGLVHQDLRPSNVVLVPDAEVPCGRALILGLGEIGLLRHLCLGTDSQPPGRDEAAYYSAPELGRGASDKVDVYALGALLYQMIAGVPPFIAPSAEELLRKHTEEDPRPLAQHDRHVPPQLARLVRAMLAKAPADRPSMTSVYGAMDQLLGAAPPGSPAAGGGRGQRGPLWPLQIASVVLVSLAGVAAVGKVLLRAQQETALRAPPVNCDGPGDGRGTGVGIDGRRSAAVGGLNADGGVRALVVEPLPLEEGSDPGGSGGSSGSTATRVVRTEAELRALRRFRTALNQAHDAEGYAAALRGYHDLRDTRSPDLLPAQRAFDQKFAGWAGDVLRQAQKERLAGRCTAQGELVEWVLKVVPDFPDALAERERPCQEQGVAAAGSQGGSAAQVLKEAFSLANAGQYKEALDRARQVATSPGLRRGQQVQAWRVVGKAACRLHRPQEADEAFEQLSGDGDAQQYVILVCKQSGLYQDGGHFQ